MRNLKRLGVAVALLLALGLTAFADCPVPGVMDGPPCAAAQSLPDDSTAPEQIEGPPAAPESASVELPSIAEIALNILTMF